MCRNDVPPIPANFRCLASFQLVAASGLNFH
jgi:hypothetical protein